MLMDIAKQDAPAFAFGADRSPGFENSSAFSPTYATARRAKQRDRHPHHHCSSGREISELVVIETGWTPRTSELLRTGQMCQGYSPRDNK